MNMHVNRHRIGATMLRDQSALDTLRMQTEQAIDMLIAPLDVIDSDTDLEPYLTASATA